MKTIEITYQLLRSHLNFLDISHTYSIIWLLLFAEPFIERVSPNHGPQSGGTRITLSGENLKTNHADGLKVYLESEVNQTYCDPDYDLWLVHTQHPM